MGQGSVERSRTPEPLEGLQIYGRPGSLKMLLAFEVSIISFMEAAIFVCL